MSASADVRRRLAERQQSVLRALLAGRTPAGFDEPSARLTARVLAGKRRSEAAQAVPELRAVPEFAERFDAWAYAHPCAGCPHHDGGDFLLSVGDELPEPAHSRRSVEAVYARRSRWASDRRAGHRRWVIATGDRVWHVGPTRH